LVEKRPSRDAGYVGTQQIWVTTAAPRTSTSVRRYSIRRYWQAAAVGFAVQQVWNLATCVGQAVSVAVSVAVKSTLPLESHFSFENMQFSIAWYWLPQAEANAAWQELISAAVGAVSCEHLPFSEHEASPLPQPENAIAVTVIIARRSLCISCPSKFRQGKIGLVPDNGTHTTLPGKAAQEGVC
jgi:hypothetical protein